MHPSAPQATNGRNGAFAGKSVTRGLYEFTIDYAAPFTVSKDQARTGTCWCFATIAMLESDILRNTGQELDLSEMWVVRNTYPQKPTFMTTICTRQLIQGHLLNILWGRLIYT